VFVALNGRAKKLPVTVGGATAQGVMIESGLIGGEDLIVDAPADLKDGQRVQPRQ
jgi:HlyD family secretion protein